MAKNKEIKNKKIRKWWFKLLKRFARLKYKKTIFVYLGEEISNGSIILSNHEGTDSPMTLEIYLDKNIRFWGAHEMNSGLKTTYKYLSEVYYHQKKGWNLHLARAFCLLAAPLSNLFYKGLNLISTYPDARLKTTMHESLEAIKNGENIIIFPENSEKGYLSNLTSFYSGFVLFAEICKRNGIDVPIYTSYYNKKKLTYIIDKPIKFSELSAKGETREEIAKKLCNRCNELGEMTLINN